MAIIEIKNLSKKYLISHEGSNINASLKELLTQKAKRFFQKVLNPATPLPKYGATQEEFWALRDLNLTIEEGDRVALLGRNGAGKSTLLKLLSRIIEPTKGRIALNGRVASLLEVGTGFHPELTGRENIMLSGAIMGMGYKEIRRKFDAIIAFADIEKFLDTPIKRYSSGMFMRLGFAIIAHLDSEILILDEVLAVGDTQFQEKCLKKMNDMGAEGRTVLFVSHSISSVLSLCNKGVFLEKGRLRLAGPIDQCIQDYMHSCPTTGFVWKEEIHDEYLSFYRVALVAPKTKEAFFYQNEKTALQIDFDVHKSHPDLIIGFSIFDSRQQLVAHSRLCDHADYRQTPLKKGTHQVSFDLDLNLFHPGEYHLRVNCVVLNHKKILNEEILLNFTVCSPYALTKQAIGDEKEGICLGNQWKSKQASLTVDPKIFVSSL